MEQQQFGDHVAAPSVFAADPAAYGIMAAVLLLTVALPLAWMRRRSMRRRRLGGGRRRR